MSPETRDYRYTSADGLSLHCRIYPGGRAGVTPVLCLPGLTRNSRDFETLARHLNEAGREVLAADLRGRGRSDRDPDPSHYQLPTYVADAFALLDSLKVERVALIGTSLGALMSMAMGAMQPKRIAGAVLNDAGPEIDPKGIARIAAYAGKLPPVRTWAEAAAQTRAVYGEALPGLTEADWLEYARRGYRENEQGIPVPDVDPKIAEAFKSAPATPASMWPLFATLRALPLLVVRGAHSDILAAQTLERMAREHPALTPLSVPNRGHAPLLDEPECVRAIDAFLARLDQTT